MEKLKNGQFVGIASLFNADQLKSFFMTYIHFMVVVEIVLFLIIFLGTLGADRGTFPVRFYFFLSFSIPVAITFLLGLFIIAFNKYIFGKESQEKKTDDMDINEETVRSYSLKINFFFHLLKKIPFLGAIFFIFMASLLVYKSDKILGFIVTTSDKLIMYGLYGLCICLVGFLIYGLTLIIANYKLKKSHMEFQYRYKNEVMERFELLFLNDDKVIDKNGHVVSEPFVRSDMINPSDRSDHNILPPPQ